ncbi:MAG: hypothetical protein KKF12_12770 [Proteobacteria bacterium]|nr:hypothetical protein [Desulfobacula sp.]MBU3951718.1 hypothetical protein [Pseudomonadota bacterium]MBU4131686.1 hypothetical protein [Pseudomonadota bacterium]
MIQRLGSVTLTFYTLVVLIWLMGAGVFFSTAHGEIFLHMNEVHICDWIMATWEKAPLPVVWFLSLCLGAAILFMNALCCSMGRQWSLAKKSGLFKNWLFFFLHCLFIVVLACHGLILALGEKQSRVHLFPGQDHSFGPYEIQLTDVVFTDDLTILKTPKKRQRALMTRKNIHIHENHALLTLVKNDHTLARQKIRMLSPLRYKSVQVTLVEFVIQGADDRLGVVLNLTDNFLNRFFFLAYAIMILSLAVFTAITWKRPSCTMGKQR